MIMLQLFREISVKNFDASKFVTDQVFYKSKDGTKIPMFIVHKKVRYAAMYLMVLVNYLFLSWLFLKFFSPAKMGNCHLLQGN